MTVVRILFLFAPVRTVALITDSSSSTDTAGEGQEGTPAPTHGAGATRENPLVTGSRSRSKRCHSIPTGS